MSHRSSPSVFLTAEWRHLTMVNYEIDPKFLRRWFRREPSWIFGTAKPSSVSSDFFFKRHVCAELPFHFIETLKRSTCVFIVRRRADDGWRRAVVFIKEIVPRFAIAAIARALYNEPYLALPTSHQIEKSSV